jgi:TonB-dependent starch-binding outer membrane protein SusC
MKKLLQSLFILLFVATTAMAQDRTITGTVTSKEDGLPLPGVSVKVKGSSIGASTNANGKFTLVVKGSVSALEITSLGFVSQTVNIGSSNTVNVSLESDSKALTEVVVTGYGTVTKLTQTGAVTQIGGEELENQPLTSFDKALQGRVAGLQSIGGSGQPGSIQQVRIRGIGSMTAGAAPLYVIDGIPINSGDLSRATTTANALAGINPNDIETITVLKDASAASIYGARAANGVIVVTTKKGKAGATKIRVDAEYGRASVGYLNERNRPLTTSEWKELTAEGLLNAPAYVTAYGLTPANVGAFVDANFNTGAGVNTNWIDQVTRDGNQAQYNVSANGGNEKTQFNVSAGYFKQEGTVIASEFNRYSANVNLTHKATDKLTFTANLVGSNSNQKGPGNGGLFANPVLTAYFLLPSYAPYEADGTTPNITSSYFAPGSLFNPLYIAKYDKRNSNFFKGLGSFSGSYQILPNLKFTSKYGIDYNNNEEDTYNNPYHGDGRNDSGRAGRYYTRYFNWVWTNLFDYSFKALSDESLSFNLKAGYEAQKSSTYFSNTVAYTLPLNTNIIVPSAGSVYNTATGSNSDYTFASMLALGDVSYKGRYVLSGSFRRDGSSRFGADNRYGNFWSVGASWNIDQEDFFKSVNWIDQLKLRGSYGKNGNADIGNYDWRPLYGYGAAYNYQGLTGSAPVTVGNLPLTWEENKPLDIGVDASFLKGRLNVTLEWYTRTTSSLLLNEPLSRTSGFSSFVNNVGSMKNRGYEITLNGTPVVAGDFKWDASFNISHNKNKILTLVNNQEQLSSPFIRRVGLDYQTFYVPLWAGVNPTNGAPLWYTDETKTATTSTYASAKRGVVGSASPSYFGSFGSTFSYKGFSLDALLYYNFGNLVRDGWANYTQSDGYNATFNRTAYQLARWTPQNTQTNVPKYVYGGANSSNSLSDRFIYKGDYVRLREVTLGYAVPKQFLSQIKLSSAKIYVRGVNLLTWVKDKNLPWDPEAGGIGGGSNFDVYIPKTFTVGVNVGF